MKNIFDGANAAIALIIAALFLHSTGGVGIGTIIAFLGVGRVVALYNATLGRVISSKVFGIQ